MTKGTEAFINSELLVWARKNSGLSVVQAAEKVGVTAERLRSWETGESRPTINQLRKLAQACKRPIAVFYLPKPPRDFQPLRDYRRLPSDLGQRESPALLLEVRRALARRDIALELYRNLDEEPPTFEIAAHVTEDPDDLAAKLRKELGVTGEIQRRFRTQYEALNGWRTALEERGILVFQATGVDLTEMRAFSVTEKLLPFVVTNSRDSALARIFSMLHEFVHVAIHEGGVCDLNDDDYSSSAEQQVEVFCNRVAGAVLVPRGELLREELVLAHGAKPSTWSNDEIRGLSRRFWVSDEVVVRRLLICGLTTREFYLEKRAEFAGRRKPTDKAYVSQAQKVVSRLGRTFVRLVLDNYYGEHVTSSDVSDFLNVNLKHLRSVEEKVMGHSVMFGAVA
jgi:Zn-dependent peptidase ImmA (M78 family)